MTYEHETFNIYYEKYGNSTKNLIIFPGWGDTRKTFNYFINYFKNYYTIYIFDYPGFGNTIFPNKDLTIYDYAKVFNDFIDDFNIINPILLCHSFGGRIAILLENIYNKHFKKLILIDTAGIKNYSLKKEIKKYTYKFLKKLKIFFRNKEKYLKKLLNIFGSKDYIQIDKNMQKSFINIVNENLKNKISTIKSETLIIWGDNDLETPFKDAIQFNKLIKNSYLIKIDNSNHFPYLEYPNLFLNIIYEYLKDDINNPN